MTDALPGMPHADDPVLCYVDQPWAWFTPVPLSEQTGDDWNDTPYEHNAEEPYNDLDVGGVRIEYALTVIGVRGEYDTPCSNELNSRWSVERINAGGIAWLFRASWSHGKPWAVPAGTPLSTAIRILTEAGCEVYTRHSLVSS